MTIKKFEDIDAWRKARELTREVYNLTSKVPFSKDFGLSQQTQRAAVSIMNNIAEGFDSGTNAEFIRFLSYARRSASEVQCNLYVALDNAYIDQAKFDVLYADIEEIRKMITGFMKYLKGFSKKLANSQTGKLVTS